MLNAENLLTRVDELLKLQFDEENFEVVGEVYSGTIALATQIWGESSTHVHAAKQLREDMQNSKWRPVLNPDFLFVSAMEYYRPCERY